MKVVLIDDEPLALQLLQLVVRKAEPYADIVSFKNFKEALKPIQRLQPDVIFLDIHMPETNGLEAAEQIHAHAPRTQIVFVTAHRDYAVDAFELGAIDYVVKPVTETRLRQSLKRLKQREETEPAAGKDGMAIVCCMGRLHVRTEESDSPALRWRTTKVKELFAYLLHHRGQIVSKDKLLERLWTDADEHKGLVNLQSSIYRIRSTLKAGGLEEQLPIAYSEYGYILENRGVLIDVEEWERLARQLPPLSHEQTKAYERILRQYTGDYFGEEQYFWAETERRRFRSMWLQYAAHLQKFYMEHDQTEQALSVCLHLIKTDPLLEEGYFGMMQIYDRLQDSASVDRYYQLLIETLKREADLEPAEEIVNWYNSRRNV